MDRKQIEFKIDQLRKDKIIYAVESIALSAVALIAFLAITFMFDQFPYGQAPAHYQYLRQAIVIIPILYWFYMVVSNLIRLIKIRRLEKQLHAKPKT